jgi:hypothetical protein
MGESGGVIGGKGVKTGGGKRDDNLAFVFVLDVVDVEGVGVCIFGKELQKTRGTGSFVHCCVIVKGIDVVSYVLPRDGCESMSVYKELSTMRDNIKGKPVSRMYVLGDPDIPRLEKLRFIKVKSNVAICGVIPPTGKTYSKVCTAFKNRAERLTTKLNLVGPQWISVPKSSAVTGPRATTCASEYAVEVKNILIHNDMTQRGCELVVAGVSLNVVHCNGEKQIVNGTVAFERHRDFSRMGIDEPYERWVVEEKGPHTASKLATELKANADVIIGLDLFDEVLPLVGRICRLEQRGRGDGRHTTSGIICCDIGEMVESTARTSLPCYDACTILIHLFKQSDVVRGAYGSKEDARLLVRAAQLLQCLSLPFEMARISGTTWATAVRMRNSDHAEAILVRELTARKVLCPVASTMVARCKRNQPTNSTTPKYQGGCVMNVQQGIVDGPLVVLDFSSLYPSLIAEYDLCFSSVRIGLGMSALPKRMKSGEALTGMLANIMWDLVSERRKVISQMTTATQEQRVFLEIRQLSFKRMANALYGCLAMPSFRFFLQELAELITRLGRISLQELSDYMTKRSFNIVYGDTDSVFATHKDKDQTVALAQQAANDFSTERTYMRVTVAVHKTVFFRSKKKYAAWSMDGRVEYKGLEVVRRDWCAVAKNACKEFLGGIGEGKRGNDLKDHGILIAQKVGESIKNGTISACDCAISKIIGHDTLDSVVRVNAPQTRILGDHVVAAKDEWARGRILPPRKCISYIVTTQKGKEDSPWVPTPIRLGMGIKDVDKSRCISGEYVLEKQVFPCLSRLFCSAGVSMTSAELRKLLGMVPTIARCNQKKGEEWVGRGMFEGVEHIPLSIFCQACTSAGVPMWDGDGMVCENCGAAFESGYIKTKVMEYVGTMEELKGTYGVECNRCWTTTSPLTKTDKEEPKSSCSCKDEDMGDTSVIVLPLDMAIQFSYLRHFFVSPPKGLRPNNNNISHQWLEMCDNLSGILMEKESALKQPPPSITFVQ